MLNDFEKKYFSLMAEHLKLIDLSHSLDDNLEKTEALTKSTKAYSLVVQAVADHAGGDDSSQKNLDILLELIGCYDELKKLTSSSFRTFVDLDAERKGNKKFLLLALMSGVDGRLLAHVSPYLIFTDHPKKEQKFDDWYENATFDKEFFRLVTELNEHSFYGFWSNPKIEEFVAQGYDKFDIWEIEEAWVCSLKNPKFLKYHEDFHFNILIEEWKGTSVEAEVLNLVNEVKSDISRFAAEVIDDYFTMTSRGYIEKKYDITFNAEYILQIINTQSDQAALIGRNSANEIYSTTNLLEFERLIQFIYSI